MTTLFSGVWQADNTALHHQLTQLQNIALQEFDIEISINKMLADISYRQLVLSELAQLKHHKITDIINWLNNPKTNTTHPKKSVSGVLIAVVACVFLMLTAFLFINTSDSNNPPLPSTQKATQATSVIAPPKSSAGEVAQVMAPIKVIEKPAKLLFSLHGSNTIGEKLAPRLLEGFLIEQGASELTWQQGEKPVERQLTFTLNNEKHYVDLQAHGSSTAFLGLAEHSADMGMSSRRIKEIELKGLQSTSGKLDGVGNEHIIGLDALAIIVNQNNPVKQLSTQTLAKIFSGEISNWSQIGGSDQVIKLFARDTHSGTWDTFKNLVLKKHDLSLASSAQRFESSSKLSTQVSQNEGAIGFIGLNYVLHNKALAISATKKTNAIYPTRFTVSTEDYPLSRRLYFYTPTNAADTVKEFAHYAISAQGQNIVANTGLVSQNIQLEQAYPLENAPEQYNQYTQTAKRLSLNFRFDYATKDLDNKGKRDLQRLVEFMEQHVGRRIVLMGFSDSVGAKLKNKNLALQRAKSVERALTSRGIPVLSVEALGEALPIANNDTEEGRMRNRRVEVWLL
ncbi:phosphate ABC transporter substrate-binding/OmpA family protein [Colwellia asteriadis]|uniref:Phosphate ABC transporter substrate-binding/OmpA family protein n=1 Tax=Colwellia asteriadis TaxID=517723 RepID=A0ABN1L2V9_9GAMM